MEMSEAVKCPSVPAQLAGMKKIQQLLCDPRQLHLFLEPVQAEMLSRTFARIVDPSGGSDEAQECVRAAMHNPSEWVLKPQIEGSGNLIFEGDIPKVLKSRTVEELAEYILMRRVRPPVLTSAVYLLEDDKRAKVVIRASVGELGVFGAFVAEGMQVLRNEAVGHLLRSKAQHTAQGGVFVGNAAVDSPILLPPDVFWQKVLA